PTDANARTSRPPRTAMPGRTSERSTYARPARGWTRPLSRYGFSTGLTSIAWPYACTDQRRGPGPTAYRQLKAAVLSAASGRSSLEPYAVIGRLRRSGERRLESRREA